MKNKKTKKYKIEFVDESKDFELIRKYNGKEMTLSEIENIIEELGQVIFDGEIIIVFNNYIE